MSKTESNPKPEGRSAGPNPAVVAKTFRHWDFGICSSFVIRHSSF
jgi:hypothetical protein